jgi:hypothetical protein
VLQEPHISSSTRFAASAHGERLPAGLIVGYGGVHRVGWIVLVPKGVEGKCRASPLCKTGRHATDAVAGAASSL